MNRKAASLALGAFLLASCAKKDAASYISEGEQALSAGKNEQAVRFLEQGLGMEPGLKRGYNPLGTAYLRLGNYDRALQYLLYAAQNNPSDYDSLAKAASAYMRKNETAEAAAYFGKAIAIKQDIPELYAARGTCLLKLQKPQEAAADFEKLTALSPDNAEGWDLLSQSYAATGDVKKAREACVRAAKQDGTPACQTFAGGGMQ